MAKKNAKNLTIEQNEVKEQQLKPYCELAAIAAEAKSKADALRPMAAEELRAKLDADPETRDFTGTVVYLCDDKIYKIRVQRPDSTDWLSKRLKDPNHKQYKQVKADIAKLELQAKKLESDLATAHPRCVSRNFVIAYMTK